MSTNKKQLTRLEEWVEIVENMEDFLYDDNGIYTISLFDKELRTYSLDLDKVKELIQKLKDYEEKYEGLLNDEKETILMLKQKFLEIDNGSNGINQMYEKMSNMYDA